MIRSTAVLSFLLAALLLTGCTKEVKHEAKLFSSGEKATVGNLTYSVVDSQIFTRLGDDPATARMPQNRFIVVQVSVQNSGSTAEPIPAMTLVDDSGQVYNELPDGTGVQRWLGISPKVGPSQSETGTIVFDAPAKHYKLRLTDELAADEVAVDMPLSFIHEQMQQMTPDSADSAPK